MTETTKRILQLMEKNGDTAHSLEVNAKLPISSVAGWKNDKFKPAMDSIIKLARYFNVSADYLLCLSDKLTPLKQADIAERQTAALSTELIELSHDERFVDTAKLYKAMPNKYREEVYVYLRGIAVGLGLNIQQILGR